MSEIVELLLTTAAERSRATAQDDPPNFLNVVAKISRADAELMNMAASEIMILEGNWNHLARIANEQNEEIKRLSDSDNLRIESLRLLREDNERLRKALRECEAELDSYYRAEYPHQEYPSYVRKLENALASNPARLALEGKE